MMELLQVIAIMIGCGLCHEIGFRAGYSSGRKDGKPKDFADGSGYFGGDPR